ncbi:DUF2920 family protein [Roseospira navarrensis]|uniref:DUF2920 family protein n=1 Tax=Roseospira navarrensis TaxID=140058 RepID=A0A7X2D4P7_9PROT|nr:DUF2920 family protein [Roseospira navarrensis]MQX36415.1 DUF2920 family protein [Roseospira navarrensis]
MSDVLPGAPAEESAATGDAQILAQTLFVDRPHPDIEFGYPRQRTPVHMAFPANLPCEGTPVILVLGGWGAQPMDAYFVKLRRYLAATYGALVLMPEYFDLPIKCRPINADPTIKVRLLHGHWALFRDSATSPLADPLAYLRARGVTAVPPSLGIHAGCYFNYGFLSTLDVLTAYHWVVRRLGLVRPRPCLFGTSYGGYLCLLAAHYAPDTFPYCVVNAPLLSAREREIFNDGSFMSINGIRVPYVHDRTLTDAVDPEGFARGYAPIRDMSVLAATVPSRTRVYWTAGRQDMFHDVEEIDTVRRNRDATSGAEMTRLRYIGPEDLDGVRYKTLDHGFKASLRGVFREAAEVWWDDPTVIPAPPGPDDFARRTTHTVDFGAAAYAFHFHEVHGLLVERTPGAR